jgi:pilus assembly protein Flp/PilA
MLALYVKCQTAWQSLKDEQGQDLIEYALLAALIAVACTAAMGTLAAAINTEFGKISGKLT